MANLFQATQRIAELGRLSAGWDYGRGSAPSVSAQERARTILSLLWGYGLRRFNVAPGANGGITVAAVQTVGNEIEIYCRSTGAYDLYISEGGQDLIEREAIGFVELNERLRGIGWLRTKSSTWFIPNVTCLSWDDSQASLSKIHLTGRAYQLSVLSAQNARAGVFVDISGNTQEPPFAANLPSIGVSDHLKLQTA